VATAKRKTPAKPTPPAELLASASSREALEALRDLLAEKLRIAEVPSVASLARAHVLVLERLDRFALDELAELERRLALEEKRKSKVDELKDRRAKRRAAASKRAASAGGERGARGS
jgi:hypothetical protein